MADGQSSELSAAQAEAFAVLSSHFGDALRPLPPAVVAKVADGVGWSLPLPVDHTGQERSLWILLVASFPETPPVVLVSPSSYGTWPHVTLQGTMCLWYDGMAPVGYTPESQIRLVLERVAEILGTIYPQPDHAHIEAEFAKEWLNYWLPPGGGLAHASALLLDVPPWAPAILPTRTITMADRRRFMLVGADDEQQTRWASAFGFRLGSALPLSTVFVPLPHPVVGAPTTLEGVMSLLRRYAPGSDVTLAEQLNSSDGPVLLVVGVPGDSPAFAALELTLLPDTRPHCRAPQNAREARNRRVRRKPDRWRVKVIAIERADARWIHGRGFDTEAAQLAGAHVWVIGCGSLGGLVIRSLAAAGVGRLTLVDDERLEPPNLGRHVLGVQDLHRYKAVALAEQLRGQLPHLRVDALTRKFPFARPQVGADAPDLVISTTANWPADLRLMSTVTRGEIPWAQITWAEPHAVAGHSLLLNSKSDARALFNDEGRFQREVTTWPVASRALPGCAGTHQPGTFNRLQRVAGLAVEQAISHLLGRQQPEHLAWLGDTLTLQRLGGSWRNSAAAPTEVRERTLVFSVPERAA